MTVRHFWLDSPQGRAILRTPLREPEAVVVPAPSLIATDHFDYSTEPALLDPFDGTALSSDWEVLTGAVTVADGKITATSAAKLKYLPMGNSVEDCCVMVSYGSKILDAGVMLRMQDADNGYIARHVLDTGTDYIRLYKVVAGVETQLDSYALSNTARIYLEAVGNQIRVYAENVSSYQWANHLHVTDDTWTTGFVGIQLTAAGAVVEGFSYGPLRQYSPYWTFPFDTLYQAYGFIATGDSILDNNLIYSLPAQFTAGGDPGNDFRLKMHITDQANAHCGFGWYLEPWPSGDGYVIYDYTAAGEVKLAKIEGGTKTIITTLTGFTPMDSGSALGWDYTLDVHGYSISLTITNLSTAETVTRSYDIGAADQLPDSGFVGIYDVVNGMNADWFTLWTLPVEDPWGG